jgi:predicted unusual protein kinase regulating ubiquinone biosynthesis (AarF/ABC1/UbiB family)
VTKSEPGDGFDDRLARFLTVLRTGRHAGPDQGLRRLLRTTRGAVGLASRALRLRGRESLGDAELANIERLVTRLGELKGVPMKAGQMMGFLEADLPEEMRRLLALLQTQAPAAPWVQVQQVIREDLGARAEALLAAIDPIPASVASIGQVHRARLPDGEDVAVKVRHPGIGAAIRSDFEWAASGSAFASLIVPGAGRTARDFVAEARDRLLEECDYGLEADRQRRYGEIFSDHPDVVVPRVLLPWCAPRVLVTDWETGRDFDRFAATADQGERDRAGRALFEVYVGTLYRHGLFHADPHPGNYRFREDGKVVVFDYGCVRVFDPQSVAAFVGLAQAVRAGDEAGMRSALRQLGAEPPAGTQAFVRVRALLEGFFAPLLRPGAHRIDGRINADLGQMTRDKLQMARLRLPGKLLVLLRIRFGLYSVLGRLGAECDFGAIEQSWAEAAQR